MIFDHHFPPLSSHPRVVKVLSPLVQSQCREHCFDVINFGLIPLSSSVYTPGRHTSLYHSSPFLAYLCSRWTTELLIVFEFEYRSSVVNGIFFFIIVIAYSASLSVNRYLRLPFHISLLKQTPRYFEVTSLPPLLRMGNCGGTSARSMKICLFFPFILFIGICILRQMKRALLRIMSIMSANVYCTSVIDFVIARFAAVRRHKSLFCKWP